MRESEEGDIEDSTAVVIGSADPITLIGLDGACRRTERLTVRSTHTTTADLLAGARSADGSAVAVVDFGMLGTGETAVVEELRALGQRVLLFGDDAAIEPLPSLLRAGVGGFARRGASVEELSSAVRGVAASELTLDAEIHRSVTAKLLDEHDESPGLTDREREVLHLAGAGLTSSQIGVSLHLSESTVKKHLIGASRKLGVRGRAATVARALRLGLLAEC